MNLLGDGLTVHHLILMFLAVVVGSVLPVLPNGAAVSVAAVGADWAHPAGLAAILALAAVGAWIGDVITYVFMVVVSRSATGRSRWIKRDATAERIGRLRDRIDRNDFQVLTVSRLIPAGRLPVLVATAVGGYPVRRYLIADVPACAVWSAAYAAIGLASGVFSNRWIGTSIAIALVIAVTVAGQFFKKSAGQPAETSAQLTPTTQCMIEPTSLAVQTIQPNTRHNHEPVAHPTATASR